MISIDRMAFGREFIIHFSTKNDVSPYHVCSARFTIHYTTYFGLKFSVHAPDGTIVFQKREHRADLNRRLMRL